MKRRTYLIFILLCITYRFTYADSPNVGVFDSILNSVYDNASKWLPKLLDWAKYFFWTLSFLEFAWIAGFKKMFAGQLDKLFIVLMSRVIVAGLLFDLFVKDPNLYLGIVKLAVNIGASLGGSFGTTTGSSIYSVSGLFQTMWTAVKDPLAGLIVAAAATGVFSSSLGNFLFGFVGIIIIVILTVCVTVMWILGRSWIILFGGFLMTGFIGSNWTRNYWQSYLKFIVGVALSLLMLSLVLLIVSAQWSNSSWLPPLPEFSVSNADTYAVSLITRIFATLGVCLFDVVLVIGGPALGASLASGTINAGLGEAIGAAAGVLSGGFMMGKAAQGGVATAGQVAKTMGGAGDAARSAAMSNYRDSLKNGISGGEGTDGNFKEMAKQQARDAGQEAKSKHMKSGLSDAGDTFKDIMTNVSRKGSSTASNLARGTSGGSASGASVNTNTPHQ